MKAKQARGHATINRLLDAAEQLLDDGGIDAATVPAIAERANVSVGTIYRHFADKDELLRAVYHRFFDSMHENNTMRLQIVPAMDLTLRKLARALVVGLAVGYRQKRGILRALIKYVAAHPDKNFRRNARRRQRATMDAVVALLMKHRSEICHPHPELAVEFGLLAVASTLENVILEQDNLFEIRPPANLDEEVVRLFFNYLGIR